jgi:drug/metabolite transporter (DMT)-like permease
LALTLESKAKLACLYAGAIWGLFWIPLRALEQVGLHGLWITVVYYFAAMVLMTPFLLWRLPHLIRGGIDLHVTAMLSGGALLLYATAIGYTDVVRAMLLFYLTPVWGTVLGRIFLKEPVTALRIVAMALSIIGMLTIFGLGVRFPIPENAGDWLGLAGGFVWAVASVRLNAGPRYASIDMTIGYILWSLIFAGAAALVLAPSSMPTVTQTLPAMPIVVAFMIVLILPGTFASLWGPKYLNPGLVGLLFMTEIVVGSISVALVAGEPFGAREMLGIALIAGASLLEPVADLFSKHRTPA